MRKILLALLIASLTGLVFGQKVHKAKSESVELSGSQRTKTIAATKLHDEGKYAEAIEAYKAVLSECANCAVLYYEIGLSYAAMKDYPNAIKYLENGTRYKSRHLVGTIRMLGNVADNQGDGKKAIKIYKKGIKVDSKNPTIRYDMGIAYARQRKMAEAREQLKKAVELKPDYVGAHYVLSEVFRASEFKIPSMLAAMRVLSLESGTPRAKQAAVNFNKVFAGNVTKGKDGGLNILLSLDSSDEEGDFGAVEMLIGLLGASDALEPEEGEEPKTAEQSFVSKLDSVIALLDDDKMKDNFAKRNYIKFLVDAKKKGYSESFGYLLLRQLGNKKADEWISSNGSKYLEFIEWARFYKP